MKKIFAVLFVAVSILGFASCKKKDQDTDTSKQDQASVDKAVAEIDSTIDLLGIDEVKLPLEVNGCTVKWESTKENVVNNNGEILRRSKKIQEIPFNCTVTKGEASVTKQYTFKIYPKNFDFIQREFLSNIPHEVSEDCDTIITDFYNYYTVEWSSSNPELFNEDGKYIKPKDDTEITIKFKIIVDETHYKEYEEQIMILGITDEERKDIIRDFLITGPLSELNVDHDMILPDECPRSHTPLKWYSTNEEVISSTGKVNRCVYERFCYLMCQFEIKGILYEIKFKMSVVPLDISKMTEEEILANWADSIAVKNISRTKLIGYADFVQSFNRLYFFNNILDPQFQQIVPKDEDHPHRPGLKDPSIGTQLVVVHDTANNSEGANAKAHANFVNDPATRVSFQYVVGNDGVYHMIPDNEVSWHAGDGSRKFGMNDTGVKANSRVCNITLTKDGYFAFNGVKGKIRIPDGATPGLSGITDSGLVCEVGPNGNYWLINTYFSGDYRKICNAGGNQNSIGIETCVNRGSDYLLTVKNLANLVAQLVMNNNLTLNRVLQHNNMSGKDCPRALRASDSWQAFIDEISCIRFFNEHFKDVTVIWTPEDSKVLGVDGRIRKDVTGIEDVRYSVLLKRGDKVLLSKSYSTHLVVTK